MLSIRSFINSQVMAFGAVAAVIRLHSSFCGRQSHSSANSHLVDSSTKTMGFLQKKRSQSHAHSSQSALPCPVKT